MTHNLQEQNNNTTVTHITKLLAFDCVLQEIYEAQLNVRYKNCPNLWTKVTM